MEQARGLVVRAMAGKEKGGFYVVIRSDDHFAWIADGKRRKLEHPKKKNIRHIQATANTVCLEKATDKMIRSVLKQYQ